MALDYSTLKTLRKNHPAWKLLVADHSPLIAGFVHKIFIAPNRRRMGRADLASALEDYLFALRETEGQDAFPRRAEAYLDEWAGQKKGWLKKFYPQGSDEVHYDLMPWVEKALIWLENLIQSPFIGTESRLMTVFDLLHQMVQGTEMDAPSRIEALERQRAEIDAQLARVREGHMDMLDDTALKDRFLQIDKTARELLGDFREVEYNFRRLDQKTREQIALWEGSKGDLLENFFEKRDVIAESDQGKSFNAFWDLLMSPARQDKLSVLLHRVFEPLRIPLKHPTAKALTHGFDAARTWIGHLMAHAGRQNSKKFTLEWQEINHRTLGRNRIPRAVIFHTLDQIFGYLGKTVAAERYQSLFKEITAPYPELADLLIERPLDVLAHDTTWPSLLAILSFMRQPPLPWDLPSPAGNPGRGYQVH